MRVIYLAAVAVALGVVIIVAGAAVASSSANRIQLRAALTAGEEVPAPRGDVTSARGVFTATTTRTATGATLNWTLTFSGLTGASNAAHIHTGARNVSGPVTVPLCGPCESGATGTANVDANFLNTILSGGAYVNVHTATNAPGEIRAQLGTVVATVTPVLNARQEVPKPKGAVARATGRFTLTATKSDTNTTLAWRLTFSRLTDRAAAAHIHIGARGRAGAVAVPLCAPCRSGARGNATVSGAALTALEAGRAYVNVHTPRNPAGEIRGQIPALPLTITP